MKVIDVKINGRKYVVVPMVREEQLEDWVGIMTSTGLEFYVPTALTRPAPKSKKGTK